MPSGQQNIAGLNSEPDADALPASVLSWAPWALRGGATGRNRLARYPRGSYDEALTRLVQRVKAWQFRPGEWLRHSERVADVAPLVWLQQHDFAPRCFWQGRGRAEFSAGLGVALDLSSHQLADAPVLLARMQELLQSQEGCFLGGVSFAGTSGVAEWAGFPAVRFLLPTVELRQQGSDQRLAVNLLADTAHEFLRAKTRLLGLLCRLQETTASSPIEPMPRLLERSDSLSQAETESAIMALLQRISAGELRKAVLARRVDLRFSAAVPAYALLQRWQQGRTNSHCFALEADGQVFMGCSPERLFLRRGRLLETESLAGTVRRGETAEEDAALGRSLHQDPKLIHEHTLVTDYIRERLAGILRWELPTTVPQICKLDRIQHRYQPLTGVLRPGVGDADILAALHPTPAVCGLPRARAETVISALEPVQRGWYSGVVGQMSRGQSEFAVAIRSVLVQRERIHGYSGVGVVAGSEPRQEWQELEAKMEAFLALLHV